MKVVKFFMKFFILLCGLSLGTSLQSFGYQVDSQNMDRRVRAVTYQLEKEMASSLETKLEKIIGPKNFWLTVNLTVDKNKLKKEYNKLSQANSPKKNKKTIGKVQALPGLPIAKSGAPIFDAEDDEQQTLMLNDTPDLDGTFVLSFIEDVKVELAVPPENEQEVQSALKRLLAQHFEKLEIPVRLKVDRRKMSALIRSQNTLIQSENTNLSKDGKESSFMEWMNFLKEIKKNYGQNLILIMGGLFVASTLLFITGVWLLTSPVRSMSNSLNNAFKSLNESINSISIGSSSSNPMMDFEALTQKLDKKDESESKTAHIENPWDNLSKVKQLILEQKNNLPFLVKYLLSEKKFPEIHVLLYSFGPQFMNFLKQHGEGDEVLEFIDSIRVHDENLINKPGEMVKIINSLYKIVWQMCTNPNAIVYSDIKRELQNIEKEDLLMALKEMESQEVELVFNMIPARLVAEMASEGKLQIDGLAKIEEHIPDKDTLLKVKNVLKNVAKKFAHEKTRIEEVASFLPSTLEKKYLESAGAPMDLSIEGMFFKDPEKFMNIFDAYNLEEQSQIMASFDDNLVSQIYTRLPDIKSRRLQERKKDFSSDLLTIKRSFIDRLFGEFEVSNLDEVVNFRQKQVERKKQSMMEWANKQMPSSGQGQKAA